MKAYTLYAPTESLRKKWHANFVDALTVHKVQQENNQVGVTSESEGLRLNVHPDVRSRDLGGWIFQNTQGALDQSCHAESNRTSQLSSTIWLATFLSSLSRCTRGLTYHA